MRLHNTELCKNEIVPYLGVILENVPQRIPTPLDRAMRLRGIGVNPTVVGVIADSPAAQADLRPDDVIHSFNGRRVVTYLDLLDRLSLELALRAGYDIREAVEIWERSGFVLWYKRLERDRFPWPRREGETETLTLTGKELNWLLDGIDFFRL